MAVAVEDDMDNYNGTERRARERTGWRKSVLGLLLGRFARLALRDDTTQTRFFLGLVAWLWVGALLVPGDSFSRPTFAYMSSIAGDYAELKWTIAFALYGFFDLWLVFYYVHAKYVSVIINTCGVLLYSSIAFAVATLSGEPFPAGVAAHAGIALAAVWVLIRTGVNSPTGWRHD